MIKMNLYNALNYNAIKVYKENVLKLKFNKKTIFRININKIKK